MDVLRQAPPDRWEHGSEFHRIAYPVSAPAFTPWGASGAWYGSGRDGLCALLAHGRATRGWTRLWVPSFFCQDVLAVLPATGVALAVYPDGPLQAPDYARITGTGQAVLRVNFFGVRPPGPLPPALRAQIDLIDDHTHDPWAPDAWASEADWCLASLRKSLPAPDGAVLWSPAGHALPPPPPLTERHQMAALRKFAAMELKALYLRGHAVEKDTYRRLAVAGEEALGTGDPSAISDVGAAVLPTLPVDAWRETRRRNHRAASEALADVAWARVLAPDDPDACPFSAVIVCDTPARRDAVRRGLIARRVYPAILWTLESPVVAGIPAAHVDLSRRLLSLHCDMRYDEAAMRHVAALVRACGEEGQ